MKFEDRMEALVWKALLNSFSLGLGTAYKRSNYNKFIWVTPNWERNCKVCKAMNGVEISSEDAENLFPAHPHCICFPMPKV